MLGKPDSAVKRVLVYRLGSLGDTLIALPCLHLIERAYPHAEKRLLTNLPVDQRAAPAAAVLGGSGLIDDYESYPVGVRNPATLWRLRARIKAWRPDVLVYLMPARGRLAAWRDTLFFRLCGIRKIVGVPYSAEMQTHLQTAGHDMWEPEAARLARCIVELGDARLDDPASWDLRITPAEREAARLALQPAEGKPMIAVSLGTKVQAKDWGAENWQALLGRMAAIYPGYALVLIGAPSEAGQSAAAGEVWRSSSSAAGPVLNLCAALTPRQSAAVLAHCCMLVGHDSGPMHLAASVQTPCIAIFAARTRSGIWFPYGHQHHILYHHVDCSNCHLDVCIEQGKKCLTSITVDEVLEQVQRVVAPPLQVLT